MRIKRIKFPHILTIWFGRHHFWYPTNRRLAQGISRQRRWRRGQPK